jgi:hypothetical protein
MVDTATALRLATSPTPDDHPIERRSPSLSPPARPLPKITELPENARILLSKSADVMLKAVKEVAGQRHD